MRSIDGMKNRRRQSADVPLLSTEALPWQSDIEATEEQRTRERQNLAEMQQNRIIRFFSVETMVEVTPEEIVGMDARSLKELKRKRANEWRRAALADSEPKVDPEMRETFLLRLADGEISGRDEHNFLLLIPDPLQAKSMTAVQIFEQVMADPRQKQILAVASGRNVRNWQELDVQIVEKWLTEAAEPDSRTPVGFAAARRRFLTSIKARVESAVYQSYVGAMNTLEQTLYGERMDYYRQFELLRHEAKRRTSNGQVTPTEAPAVHYEILTPERSAEILGTAVIEGDAWCGGGIERHLTTHQLAMAQLSPHYIARFDGMELGLSEVFQLNPTKLAVLAYIPTQMGTKVRAYYRTTNQASWRYLPDYTRRTDGRIDFYCFGVDLASVTLPTILQAVLAQIETEHGVRTLPTGIDPESIVAGTTYAYDTRQEYQMQWSYGRMRGDYYQEVSPDPLNHDFGVHGSGQKKAPYTLGMDYRRLPDFDQQVVRFRMDVADIGRVTLEGYQSLDGQAIWLFGRDEKQRVWVEQVEAVSPLTTLGLRRDWLVVGDFMTPLYEHSNQAGIYGDRNDTKGARQCMWNNYLSKIPLIQEYLRRRGEI